MEFTKEQQEYIDKLVAERVSRANKATKEIQAELDKTKGELEEFKLEATNIEFDNLLKDNKVNLSEEQISKLKELSGNDISKAKDILALQIIEEKKDPEQKPDPGLYKGEIEVKGNAEANNDHKSDPIIEAMRD